jgi:hypothetical protein|tara:strand:- start:13913 stop:15859 length:1947 start_codon:yes stop_codon:yes gene_type:complete
MFLNTDGVAKEVKDIGVNITLADIALTSFVDKLRKSITNVGSLINDAAAIQTKTANAVRENLGQTRAVSNDVQKVMAESAKSTVQIGVSAEKNIELFAAINNSMMRNTFLTDSQITGFQALGMTANMTATDLATMATSFDTLGYTTDQTLVMMGEMTDKARSYGLNVSAFMGEVNKNLKLMVTYNFKDGVTGLSKMVAQAQALRIDMSKTVSFADELMSPEKAIETAAGFQMLGGSISKLGDPFALLNMAQTDMAGLQDSLVDMAAGAVSFNKESGEFDIPVTEMYRLREAAKLAGMGYQEFAEMGMKAAQKTEKLKILDNFNTVPEEQKELIANMGKIGANGNLEITMPDGTVKKIGEGFNQLVAGDYEKLGDMMDVNNMSEIEVAKESMGYLNQIEAAQKALIQLTTMNLVKSGGFDNFAEKAMEAQKLITDAFMTEDKKGGFEMNQTVIDGAGMLETQLQGGLKDFDSTAKLMASSVADGLRTFNAAADIFFAEALKKFNAAKIVEGLSEGWDTMSDELMERYENIMNSNETGSRRNSSLDGNTQIIDQETGGRGNPSTNNETGGRGNPSISSLNTNTSSIGEPTTMMASNSNVTVSGQVNLTLEGIPTNSVLDKDALANLLINNPTAMATINSQINNTLGTYNS